MPAAHSSTVARPISRRWASANSIMRASTTASLPGLAKPLEGDHAAHRNTVAGRQVAGHQHGLARLLDDGYWLGAESLVRLDEDERLLAAPHNGYRPHRPCLSGLAGKGDDDLDELAGLQIAGAIAEFGAHGHRLRRLVGAGADGDDL